MNVGENEGKSGDRNGSNPFSTLAEHCQVCRDRGLSTAAIVFRIELTADSLLYSTHLLFNIRLIVSLIDKVNPRAFTRSKPSIGKVIRTTSTVIESY